MYVCITAFVYADVNNLFALVSEIYADKMSEIEGDVKNVVITFFAPPLNDKDSKNEELRKKVKSSGRFDHGGYMFRTREVYDTYRYGGE